MIDRQVVGDLKQKGPHIPDGLQPPEPGQAQVGFLCQIGRGVLAPHAFGKKPVQVRRAGLKELKQVAVDQGMLRQIRTPDGFDAEEQAYTTCGGWRMFNRRVSRRRMIHFTLRE